VLPSNGYTRHNIFDPEDGGGTSLLNVGGFVPDYGMSLPTAV
jgi:hypothetical protein